MPTPSRPSLQKLQAPGPRIKMWKAECAGDPSVGILCANPNDVSGDPRTWRPSWRPLAEVLRRPNVETFLEAHPAPSGQPALGAMWKPLHGKGSNFKFSTSNLHTKGVARRRRGVSPHKISSRRGFLHRRFHVGDLDKISTTGSPVQALDVPSRSWLQAPHTSLHISILHAGASA